ncbi:STAS domain-containing protein [Aliamphritea hakodatensis]|uniref:STAS domain-containing protein n=1 Tax=Aliamphritea hakodatensis TaxID=2895352 RepID=UPI0022FD84B1|nr:STAS domain-containing protein [Aliamphritea hakodatensis]
MTNETREELQLPEEISIVNIGEWKDKFTDLLESSASISINAADLTRVDTAAVQLLVVFIKELQSHNIDYEWQNRSAELDKVARQLGLASMLQLGSA